MAISSSILLEASAALVRPSQASETRAVPTHATSTWPVPDANGRVVADVVQIGDGIPVVFLHGLVGLNEHWDQVVERVSDKVRCILFELPLLELPDPHCSIHGATDLTARFLAERIGEPAVLVGNSFGGHVALRIALDHPQLCRGLVLAGSAGLAERPIFVNVRRRFTRAWLRGKVAELFHDEANLRESDVDRAAEALSERHGARAMVKLARSVRRDHLGRELGRINAPTLVLWGREDVITPPEAAHEFHRGIADTRLRWIERCGHAPMIENPSEFASALTEFTDELVARDAAG